MNEIILNISGSLGIAVEMKPGSTLLPVFSMA
jgi:hypothetical protein